MNEKRTQTQLAEELLAALSMTGNNERCLAAGANKYINKPVNLKELVNTMTVLLGKN